MTMKYNIFAALLLMLAGVQNASAQKVTLHKAGGEAVEFNISRIDSIAIVGRYDTDTKEFVDLGLPSGTLWATCNIGASKPEGYGYYFAWGETEPKTSYTWGNYKYCEGEENTLTKYCQDSDNGYQGFTDSRTQLETADDAATAKWGSEWQLPSKAQIEELLNQEYNKVEMSTQKGVVGLLVTSKSNGNSIFLPAAGYDNRVHVGSWGNYWSRSVYPTTYEAWYLNFGAGVIIRG